MNSSRNVTSTTLSGLDQLLGGGLSAGSVSEFYGHAGTCKTQLCLFLSCTFAENASSGPSVVYADLKNDFRSDRVSQFSWDNVKVLDNIIVSKIWDFSDTISFLERLIENKESNFDMQYVRLVVIDGLPFVFYMSVCEKSSWFHITNAIINRLEVIAAKYNVAIIVVNHAVDYNGEVKNALGKHWGDRIGTRIQFTKCNCLSSNSTFKLRLEKFNFQDTTSEVAPEIFIQHNGNHIIEVNPTNL